MNTDLYDVECLLTEDNSMAIKCIKSIRKEVIDDITILKYIAEVLNQILCDVKASPQNRYYIPGYDPFEYDELGQIVLELEDTVLVHLDTFEEHLREMDEIISSAPTKKCQIFQE